MDIDRFIAFRKRLDIAYEDHEFEKLEQLANEYLDAANNYKDNWNYGNAIHHGNLYLGRIAIINGNINEAKKYLIKAGKTKGSAQLNSFGPNMALAKELLEAGEKDIVIQYIDLIKKFWNRIWSWRRTQKWKKQIRQGKIPDFGPHLVY